MNFEWVIKKSSKTLKNMVCLLTKLQNYLIAHHSDDEDRFIAIGPIVKGVVVVVYVERAIDIIRIISARGATKKEIALFNEFKVR